MPRLLAAFSLAIPEVPNFFNCSNYRFFLHLSQRRQSIIRGQADIIFKVFIYSSRQARATNELFCDNIHRILDGIFQLSDIAGQGYSSIFLIVSLVKPDTCLPIIKLYLSKK